jgi:small GTP-binding protein
MVNKKNTAPDAFGTFYKYNFRASRTVTVRWSQSGNKLGWLTADEETCFLHIWDRIAATYDAVELPNATSFCFQADEKFALFLNGGSQVYALDLLSLATHSIFDGEVYGANSISCSPDGKLICVGSYKADIRVFDKDYNVIYKSEIRDNGDKNLRSRSICKGISWGPSSQFIALAGFSATVIDVYSNTQKDYKSSSGLYDLVWSSDGKWLAGAASSKTIIIWDVSSQIVYRVLEGHKTEVRSISFSANSSLLASQSRDGTLILWNCADWSRLEVERSNHRSGDRGRRVVFHPEMPWLVHIGKVGNRTEVATLLLSSINIDVIKQYDPIPTITYTSAKIVLVGESGSGKTGLGWRIANNRFKEHPSTHGQQFWLVDQLSFERDDGTQCEAVLWDLAGQPDYRLIHALFLDDVDLALVLFDPTRSEDPLFGVEYWLKQLSSRQLSGKASTSPPIILVAARIDRGTSRFTIDEIKSFCKARGLSNYVETSATTGAGIPELLTLMREAIAWDQKPATVTTETFKKIKDQVLRLKEAPNMGQSIVSLEELRRYLRTQGLDVEFSKDELLAAVGHLATHGYVATLRTSKGESRILLIPELLNNLAASIVLEARRNLRGLGSLDEQHLLQSEYKFDELANLTSPERSILLDSTVAKLLHNNVCYRETDPLNSRSYLVFPELINLKKPSFDDNVATVDDVSYTVTGAISNVYASLVVLLGYTDRFTRTNQWRDHARYEFGEGMVCGFRLENELEGELDFVLYFGMQVKNPAKSLFISLFENFLASRDVSVQRYLPIRCSHDHLINRGVVREQFSLRLAHAHCPRCGEKVNLPEQNQTIQLTFEEARVVEHEERAARQRSLFEKAVYLLKSYSSQKKILAPQCFISYAWGDAIHERWVERLAGDLINAGIAVILDKWENEQLGSSVPRFVERAMDADKIIVVGTPMYRLKYKNSDPMNGYVVAAEGDIIGKRLIGTEEEKKAIIPILLTASAKESFPDLLHGRVYGDFRDSTDYAMQTIKLLMNLYEIKSRDKIVTEIMNIFEAHPE